LILFHLLYLEIGTRVELYLSMGINQRFPNPSFSKRGIINTKT